jgi:hypothetical protein
MRGKNPPEHFDEWWFSARERVRELSPFAIALAGWNAAWMAAKASCDCGQPSELRADDDA